MPGTIIDLLLMAVSIELLGSMSVYLFFFSDQPKPFRYLSSILFLPIIILDIPHMLLPDPTNIIDIATHITAGLALFLFFSNFKHINIKNRHWWSFIIGIFTILGIELFLSLLEIFMGYINPIGIDSLEDILWNTFGGMVGLVIYYKGIIKK